MYVCVCVWGGGVDNPDKVGTRTHTHTQSKCIDGRLMQTLNTCPRYATSVTSFTTCAVTTLAPVPCGHVPWYVCMCVYI